MRRRKRSQSDRGKMGKEGNGKIGGSERGLRGEEGRRKRIFEGRVKIGKKWKRERKEEGIQIGVVFVKSGGTGGEVTREVFVSNMSGFSQK
jgi:hypothetical protein